MHYLEHIAALIDNGEHFTEVDRGKQFNDGGCIGILIYRNIDRSFKIILYAKKIAELDARKQTTKIAIGNLLQGFIFQCLFCRFRNHTFRNEFQHGANRNILEQNIQSVLGRDFIQRKGTKLFHKNFIHCFGQYDTITIDHEIQSKSSLNILKGKNLINKLLKSHGVHRNLCVRRKQFSVISFNQSPFIQFIPRDFSISVVSDTDNRADAGEETKEEHQNQGKYSCGSFHMDLPPKMIVLQIHYNITPAFLQYFFINSKGFLYKSKRF